MTKVPEIINTGFKAEEPKLWQLDLPIEEISISEIHYNLDIPYLEKKGTDDWNLSPRLLIETFDIETLHANRVLKADLSFPIHIYNFNGNWIILDGVHRFTKAIMQGNKTIQVKKVSHELAIQCSS